MVRHGATRKPGARATCNDGRSYGVAGLEHSLHLSISLGQADQQRALAVGRQSVALIGRGVFALIEQGMRRHMGAQCLHHLGLAPSTIARIIGRAGDDGAFARMERGEVTVEQFAAPFARECEQAGVTQARGPLYTTTF